MSEKGKKLFELSINLLNGVVKNLAVYEDSEIDKTVYDFCRENNMEFSSLKWLQDKINNLLTLPKSQAISRECVQKVNQNEKIINSTIPSRTGGDESDSSQKPKTNSLPLQKGKPTNDCISIKRSVQKYLTKKPLKNNREILNMTRNLNRIITGKTGESMNSNNYTNIIESNKRSETINTEAITSTNTNTKNHNKWEPQSGAKKKLQIPTPRGLDTNQLNNLTNRGEDLYYRGIHFRLKTKEKLHSLQTSLEKKRKKDCSFKPKINLINPIALNKRKETQSEYNNPYIIQKYKDYLVKKQENLKSKYIGSQTEVNFSFKPKINKMNNGVDKSNHFDTWTNRKNNNLSRYIKLYNDSAKRKLLFEKLTKAVYGQNCTFHPKINTNNKNNNNFEGNNRSTRNIDIFTNWYERGLQSQWNKDKKEKELKEDIVYKSMNFERNDISNWIIKQKMINTFSKYFTTIDCAGKGWIHKDNCMFENLPPEIAKYFESVKYEILNENQSVNKKEFISVCFALYNDWDYYSKKIFIQENLDDYNTISMKSDNQSRSKSGNRSSRNVWK